MWRNKQAAQQDSIYIFYGPLNIVSLPPLQKHMYFGSLTFNVSQFVVVHLSNVDTMQTYICILDHILIMY